MPDFLANLSGYVVFLGIAGLGFLFLLASLVFGGIFEHVGAGADHHFDLGHDGPSFFSPRILSVFVTAFGGTGALATHYGLSAGPSSGLGFLSGMTFATLIYWFARFLYGQQATTQVASADFAGQVGRVVVAIPVRGVGQVRCKIGEEIVDKIARSQSGEAIGENSVVVVEQVLGEVVVVRPQ